jgi:hypothetical protein
VLWFVLIFELINTAKLFNVGSMIINRSSVSLKM